MYQLPLEDESFDIATLHLVLHYADDPAAVIQEAARVMTANARLIIVDYAPHEMEELRNQHAHRRLGFSDSKVREFLFASGLHLSAIDSLPGDPLTLKIWVATKPESHPPSLSSGFVTSSAREISRRD